MRRNWTHNAEGCANSSFLYYRLVKEVENLIRGDAHRLLDGRAHDTARLIVSQLAFKHKLRPQQSGKRLPPIAKVGQS